MILVTGAAGKTGLAVIEALGRRGAAVRAFIRRKGQREAVLAAGAADVIVGDLAHEEAIGLAMHEISALYHICPNMHPDEVEIGRRVIAAAKAAGVHHFVYHSVLHPHTEKMLHHWHKLRVEEMLFESRLKVTILQPCAYMQNILADKEAIVRDGVYRTPYPVSTVLSLVDVADVGEAAARVLTEGGHGGATYELVGTEPLTQVAVAAALEQWLGRAVRAEALPLPDWEAAALGAGLPAFAAQTLAQMFRYYAAFGLGGNPRVLGWLLQRPPMTLAGFLDRVDGRV